MRILVVEDDRKVASFIRQGLGEEGHAVEIAKDGAEALDLVLGSENVIQLQWNTAQHRNRTVLSGYIDNESLYGMTRVRLLVEALDSQGAVIRQTVNWLGDDLGASTRTFFEVPAPGPAASYRVRLFAFDRYEGDKG